MVSVILTIWKRNHLEEQIEALMNQSIEPEEIWVYHCCAFIEPRLELLDKYPKVRYQFNTHDLGFFGKFGLGLSLKTEYLYIVNDDVIPSSDWLLNSIELCSSKNAIISSAGRIIPYKNYSPEKIKNREYLHNFFIGDSDYSDHANKCQSDTIVDFGVCDWLIRTEWLNYFWSIKPHTFITGEDIHLSASCDLIGNIKTFVPRQSRDTVCGNLKRGYGDDIHASWRKSDFYMDREELLKYWIDERGWKPIKW